MKLTLLATALALSACGPMTTNENGNPIVEIAPGYTACISETSVGLTGNGRSAGLGFTARWGCGGSKGGKNRNADQSAYETRETP